jgi:DNA replication and repair protein RecF
LRRVFPKSLKINKLIINRFRNIKNISYSPASKLNIFQGSNAQGKTNILEAILVNATGSSFRSGTYDDFIEVNKDSFTIQITYKIDDRDFTSNLSYYKKQGKIFKINQQKQPHQHPERLRVVIFTPDDLYLVKGTPKKRRNFLDFALRQISPQFNADIEKYTKILKKRNLLLKRDQAYTKTFNIINEIFVEKAASIIIARINYVNLLDQAAQIVQKSINDQVEDLKIRYALSFPVENGKINMEILRDMLKKQLEMIGKEEDEKKKTMVGPHLDDINIYLNSQPARIYASQGQQRNIAVTLKLAELFAFRKIMGFYPVLLLDEVLAELDRPKKDMLIKYLSNAHFQTFLTSVNIDSKNLPGIKISTVNQGRLE